MEQYRIGVDLGGTNMAAGLLLGEHRIVKKHSIPTRQQAAPEQLAEDMTGLVFDLCSMAGISMTEVKNVGIGIPGSVSPDGVVEDANNIGFVNVPFGQMMRERLLLPVTTVNDARAAALGEYFAGAGRGSTTFQMVTIGTGIGGAYIVHGEPIGGCNGAAGEIGHMVIDRHGVLCNCGRVGCFEAYASASALKRRMMQRVPEHPGSMLWTMCGKIPEHLSGKHLFSAAAQQDPLAKELLSEQVEYLAEGIANLINALQPDVLCVGGGMSEQKEALLAPLREAVAGKLYSRHSAIQSKIVAAMLGNDAGIIGAALSEERKRTKNDEKTL